MQINIVSRKLHLKGDILAAFGFESLESAGVYACKKTPWCGSIRVILLNELADTPHNAPLKIFASRREERRKAFKTINRSGLINKSVKFRHIIIGLWRLMMKGSMDRMDAGEMTSNHIATLGKEWLEGIIEASSDDELLSMPRIKRVRQEGLKIGEQRGEKRGEQRGHKKGLLEGKARLLQRLLHKKFGYVPSWVPEKLSMADTDQLEIWGDRILDVSSIDELFKK
ncbi:DUF4351 domain-containing protein [Magnetococcales bacterium HHB-1]